MTSSLKTTCGYIPPPPLLNKLFVNKNTSSVKTSIIYFLLPPPHPAGWNGW